MKTIQAYRYELEPNNRQRTLFAKAVGAARFAYNWGLARRIEQFKTGVGNAKFTTAITQHKELNALKQSAFPWMYEVSKCAPQEALRDLDRVFKHYWQARKAGRKAGFPAFKRKGKNDSFRMTEISGAEGRHVKLPKIGSVRTKEAIFNFEGRILSATVSREVDRWFISLCVEVERRDVRQCTSPTVGADLGLTTFAVLSDGVRIEAPKPLALTIKKLRRVSRQHSRKKKGSSNRKKAVLRLGRLQRRIRNTRWDFLHKLTTQLAKTKQAVVVEDLSVAGMIRNRRLARAITDAGWGTFKRMLEYKCVWYGSELVVAPCWFPSTRRCSSCGHVGPKLELSQRTFSCSACSFGADRDLNAAKNLQWYGESHRNLGQPKTPVKTGSAAERKTPRSTSNQSSKQEVNTTSSRQ